MWGRFKLDRDDWLWNEQRAIEAGRASGCELTIALVDLFEMYRRDLYDWVPLKDFEALESDAAETEAELQEQIAALDRENDDLQAKLDDALKEIERLSNLNHYDL